MLSHEIVIVRASRRDAHRRDRYLLRIHLLFKGIRVISTPPRLSSGVRAGGLIHGNRNIVPVDRSDFHHAMIFATPRTKLMSDMDVAHLSPAGRSADDRTNGAYTAEMRTY